MYFLDLPLNWSWFIKAPHQIEISRNQGKCACCWAIAVASCLGDRFALRYNIKSPKPSILSAVFLCQKNKNMCGNKNGCYGGNSIKLVNMLLTGDYLSLENCLNFEKTLPNNYKKKVFSGELIKNNITNYCRNDLRKSVKFKLRSAKWLNIIGVKNMEKGYYTKEEIDITIYQIKKNIILQGPIIAEFIVSDILAEIFNKSYDSYDNMPVYSRPIDEDIEKTQNHAVVITGWGRYYNQYKQLVPYWEIRNSFGYNKNFYGIFKIEMTSYDRQKYSFGIDLPLYSLENKKSI